ncbi:MAG: DUF1330 domain-containing protein [Halioglobus sp.]
MAAYVVVNYDLTNIEDYKAYPPAVLPILEAHGAEILVADYESKTLEGNPGSVTIVIKFQSKEAVTAWYDSPEYQEIVGLRTDNSEGIAVAADEFNLENTLLTLEAL